MVYRYTIDNIMSLMQNVGTLERQQIKTFFSAELAPNKVEHFLDQLAIKHILIYNKERDTYSFIGTPQMSPDVSRRLLYAFWVIAALGSNNVQELFITRFPTQYLVITTENDVYDITVVETFHDAVLAQRIRSETLCKGLPDIINHIAVLGREIEITNLKNCGFDCYCTIDPVTKTVKYRQIED